MEYLTYLSTYLYNLEITSYITSYLFPIDYNSPETFLKSVDTKIAHTITSYLNLEDIAKVYDDALISKYIQIFNHVLPSLREANKLGSSYLFKYLARNGHIVTEYEMTVAIKHGSLEILKHIIDLGIAPQNCLIDDAVCAGHLPIVEYLISIGLQPLQSTLDLALKYGKHEIVQYLKKRLE